jgi:putative ubiquitin-RnfH superfamily antitoxin RatB of RatAB toxin-antitoxin module
MRAALDAASPGDVRELARRMREAVIEAGAAVQEMREGLERTERELAVERQQLAVAERRGRLAAEIQDGETVDVAQRFAAKHRERVGMLERKLAAQRDELALAEHDRAEMQADLARAQHDLPATEAERSAARAWRELRAAGGGDRAETDVQGDLLREGLDAAARDALAEQQLQEIKRRVKKE